MGKACLWLISLSCQLCFLAKNPSPGSLLIVLCVPTLSIGYLFVGQSANSLWWESLSLSKENSSANSLFLARFLLLRRIHIKSWFSYFFLWFGTFARHPLFLRYCLIHRLLWLHGLALILRVGHLIRNLWLEGIHFELRFQGILFSLLLLGLIDLVQTLFSSFIF